MNAGRLSLIVLSAAWPLCLQTRAEAQSQLAARMILVNTPPSPVKPAAVPPPGPAAPPPPAPRPAAAPPVGPTCNRTPRQLSAGIPQNCLRQITPTNYTTEACPPATALQLAKYERLEAERWLEYYPLCQTELQAAITAADAQVHVAAGQNQGAAANQRLADLKRDLQDAQSDEHKAYDIIQDETSIELDTSLWRNEALGRWILLEGTGETRQLGVELHYSVRNHDPIGFKAGIDTGFEKLYYPTAGDHFALPIMMTLGFGWTHTSFQMAGGGAFVNFDSTARHDAVLTGQIAFGFEYSWVTTPEAGGLLDGRFVIQPWVPFGGGHTAILFGFDIGGGFGWHKGTVGTSN